MAAIAHPLVLLILMVIAASAQRCATTPAPPTPGEAVVDADSNMVSQCQFVGDIIAEGVFPRRQQAREIAQKHAREDAATRGATHIVWVDVKMETDVSASAHGKAYRCPK